MNTNQDATSAFSHSVPGRAVVSTGDLSVGTPLVADLGYDVNDPYAVVATFRTETQDVEWTFARDLLHDGLSEPTGDGDVHVWPCLDDEGRASVTIELCSDGGDALVQLPTLAVAVFVDQMYAAVPAGTESEHIDLDRVLAEIRSAENA
jgi:Streptomyces sporulation and cell division protein, SsgA